MPCIAPPALEEPDPGEVRRIIHVDMDAFYASVEQRERPDLRGRPVAVGGARERGVVAAASYEARRFGVRSAMSSAVAARRCPDLVFVAPRFDLYRRVSQDVRAILAAYTARIEPLSLDEAYLDVTADLRDGITATAIARAIRGRIREEIGLTASAGVSYNKLLAKLASDHDKPDGLYVITPETGPAFVAGLEVGRFHGIGPVTAGRMNRLGIFTGRDLREQTREFLRRHFGSAGDYYFAAARGVDERPVQPDRPRKSIGSESTFPHDLSAQADLVAGLEPSIEAVWSHCARSRVSGRTVTLKAKFADFRQVTRSHTAGLPVPDRATLARIAQGLLASLLPPRTGIRLLGVSLSNLEPASGEARAQLPLL